MKTAATNKRVRELINLVRDGRLIPRPEFQRRLVWTSKDKDRFLDTVLRGLPFPEIYLADGDVDLETGAGTQLLVDGLQRVMTLVHYFDGSPELKLVTVPPYATLGDDQKREFLQYEVAVRDLGSASRELIIDVFKRINATKYSLTDIEIQNALYAGALKQFAEDVAENEFFLHHDVFTPMDFKRMGDLRFALSVVITMLDGYFNRDDAFEEYLSRFNDDFPLGQEVIARLRAVFEFIDECGFERSARLWKKADLFTAVIELDRCLSETRPDIQPSVVLGQLSELYFAVENGPEAGSLPAIYYKAALQASNDRSNRVRRGVIVGGALEGCETVEIFARLARAGVA